MKRPCLAFLAACCVASTATVSAQSPAPAKLEFPAPSPLATIKQRVGITDIEIVYSRPSMRGRQIFGGLEPYGRVWRTGANNATKISFSTPVTVNGRAVPAGSYELFTIPGEKEWTVIIHKNMSQWGGYKYDEKNDIVRVTTKVVAAPIPVETMAIGLADLTESSATLFIAWERSLVPVKIGIDTVGMLQPKIEAAMAGPDAKKYSFSAAMFYYENNLDLKQALAWMDAGLADKPDAYWMIYRKGLILAKMGDKAGATAAAQQSLALAAKADGAIKEEYTRLNQALLASLK